ncbi:MAG: DMT family transporter [bacterium]|nr:DMT family transporter [bacterium]
MSMNRVDDGRAEISAAKSADNSRLASRDRAGDPAFDRRRARIGAGLALLGVCSFAPTIPLSKYLVGQIEVYELAFARMLLGSLAALVFLSARLALRRPTLPSVSRLPEIAMTALGVVVGFPLLLVFALDRLPATFGSVVSGLLPLVTAVLGVSLGRERVSPWFWVPALCGSCLTVYYGLERLAFEPAVAVLLAAIVLGAMGYVFGARLTRDWNASRKSNFGGPLAIAWALALSAPLAAAGALSFWPRELPALDFFGVAAILYLGIVSQFLGFFFFYAGLAVGGIAVSSQLQLIQPFLSLGLSVLLLGESLVWLDGAAAAGIVFCVWLSRVLARST